jgi:hypothetical protein
MGLNSPNEPSKCCKHRTDFMPTPVESPPERKLFRHAAAGEDDAVTGAANGGLARTMLRMVLLLFGHLSMTPKTI